MAEQISLFDGTQPFKIDKPIRLIELFAGIGSQAKALENLGADFEHYRICEFDKYAVESYNAIHGTNFQPSDITTLKGKDLGIVDTDKYCYVMTYSFPCQDLSPAGNGKGMRKGSGTRSGLLWEVERLLTGTKTLPQVLIMENVPQVIGQKNMPDFAKWIAFLDGLGYKSKYALLNAKDYGIPQNRERCFMVSILGDYYYIFPKPKEQMTPLKSLLEIGVDEDWYYRICPSMIKAIQDGKCEILTNKEIAPTITCKIDRWNNAGFVVDKKGLRYATPKECWRLMGFTDADIDKAVAVGISNAQLYKQAGNSIVVQVLEAIFKQML